MIAPQNNVNAAAAPPSPHCVRILLVEDNDGDALLLETLIHEAQTGSVLRPLAAIARATRCDEAIKRIADGGLEVVLLDLELPDAAGLDAVATVRAAAPSLPIVVLTGLKDETTALAAIRGGAQDYLTKGDVTPELILRALRYAVERKRSEDELARARWLAGIGETALAVRHEINNPLAAILLNAEMLRETVSQDREMLEAIIACADRIRQVTGSLRSLREPRVVEYMAGTPMLDLGLGGGDPVP